MKLLTNSRAKTARSCMRLQYLSYELGYRPLTESAAQTTGTGCHAALEGRLLAIRFGTQVAIEDLTLAAAREEVQDPFELARLEAMLFGYCARWANDAEAYEVLEVEREFRAPLINPETGRRSKTWMLGGKKDAVVRERATGLIYVVEHKTAREDISPGSLYWRRLRLDSQIGMYIDGATAIGYDVAGVLYDVLGKPDFKPLKATPEESKKYTKEGKLYANQRESDETPEEFGVRCTQAIAEAPDRYYRRATMVRHDSELQEFRRDLWDTAHLIDEGRHPKNPDACLSYGSTCAFFPVCGGEASLDDQTRYRRISNVHQELEETTT